MSPISCDTQVAKASKTINLSVILHEIEKEMTYNIWIKDFTYKQTK
jgi:hypothetical protein